MAETPDTNDVNVARMAVALEIAKRAVMNTSLYTNNPKVEIRTKLLTNAYIDIYKAIRDLKQMED